MYALNPHLLGGKSIIEDWFNKTIFSGILSNTDALIGLTDQIVKYGRIHAKGSLSRYFTIPNGVNTKVYKHNLKRKLEFRRKYKIDPDAVVILFCGRFEQVKGVLEFASAMVALVGTTKNKVEVVLVGNGTLRNEVQRILSKTPCIHILSWQPHDRIHEIYLASDIFVIPSKFEGLPITVIEAMNALLHIVYTPVGGMNEILKPYSHKTILRTGTREEIMKNLSDLLSHEFPDNSDESSFIYAQSFDWDVIARSTQLVYDLVVR
jgi:glycosyltransferase involved in cell wall biosynthesis